MNLRKKIKEVDIKCSYIFPKYYHHKLFSNFMKIITGVGDFGMIWLVLILSLSLHTKTTTIIAKNAYCTTFSYNYWSSND